MLVSTGAGYGRKKQQIHPDPIKSRDIISTTKVIVVVHVALQNESEVLTRLRQALATIATFGITYAVPLQKTI